MDLLQHIEGVCAAKVLALFPYGSRVYGTANEQSDFDYIAVVDKDLEQVENLDLDNINITIYSTKLFQTKLDEHEISVLECLFLPVNQVILNTVKFKFELSLPKLRAAISSKGSNSWVKTKKKLTVEKDYAPYIGVKSLFHTFRILEFGKQIAAHGTIVDYSATNHLWKELTAKQPEEWTWPELEKLYKERYNKICSEFRALAPKE